MTEAAAGARAIVDGPRRGASVLPAAGSDPWIAWMAALLVATGAATALAGVGALRIELAATGGAALACGLVVMVAAGWVDGLVLVVLALPLPALYASEAVRVSAALVVTALALTGWWMGRTVSPRRLDSGAVPMRWGAALLAAWAFSALFATDRVGAAREIVSLTLLLFLLVAAADGLAGRSGRVRTVARALALAGALAGAAAALESAGILPGRFPLRETPLYRAAGGFGQPNGLGMLLAVILPFSFHEVRTATTRTGRILSVAGFIMVVAGLLFTFSRGAWFSTLVAPAVLFLVASGRTAARIWIGALLAAIAADVILGGAVSQRLTASLLDESGLQRLALMMAGLLMFQAHPLVGVGPGGFADALEGFGLQVPGLWDFLGTAHNAYIHIAAETGALGLVAWTGLVVTIWLRLLSRARRADPGPGGAMPRTVLWSFTVVCVLGLFELTLLHGVGQLIVLTAAMGLATPAPPDRHPALDAAPREASP
ncbi:MAG TPA: O-antigen ligase family protein [Longimicrobiales bacterium]